MSLQTHYFTSDGDFRINTGGQGVGPDGLVVSFVITGTNSVVLKKNTAPPGSAVSLTSIGYLDDALAAVVADTAITATGTVYVSREDAGFDLYAVLNWTSGDVLVRVATASVGGPEGSLVAADISPGTFGANSGATGAYAAPGAFDVVGALTAGTVASDAGVSGTSLTATTLVQSSTALATPSALAATALNAFASTVSGATLMGYGTTHDATLKNRAGTTALGVTANTTDVTAAGALDVAGALTGGTIASDAGVSGTTVLATTSASVGALAGGAAGATKLTKAVTAITDNVATTVLTITVPNAAHSATVRVTAIGVLGAGGAIGAGEANASNSYDITVVRTAGVNAVADISTAFGVNAAAVAGAATCTAALTVAAVVGAVGASNSFPVQITVVKSGGASDAHTAVLVAEVLNQNGTGVTVA